MFKSLPSPGSQDPADLALLAGLRVVDNDDDDPILLWPDGTPVDTWREDYPYDERMTRDYYDHHKRLLQIELVKLQNWVKDTGQKDLDTIKPLKGADFDRAYIDAQVKEHQTVLGMLDSQLIPNAQNAELKSLLETGLKLFESHQAHAEKILSTLKK